MSGRRAIDFTLGLNPCAPSARAKQALRKGIKGMADALPDPLASLVHHICRKESLNPENVLFGDGSAAILKDFLRILGSGRVLLCGPLSHRYRAILEGFRGTLLELPFRSDDGAAFQVDEFLKMADGTDAAIIPYPHAVTGVAPDAEELTRIIDAGDRLGLTIVIDEAYHEFRGGLSPVHAVTHSAQVLIVRSFSSFHGFLAVPLGYCIGSPGVLENLRTFMATRRFSSLTAGAALQSLRDRGFYRRTFRYIAEEKQFVVKRLSAVKGLTTIDREGNLLLLRLGPGQRGATAYCERRGIRVEEFEDVSGRGYLSFPIGKHRFNAALVNTLKRFAEEHDG